MKILCVGDSWTHGFGVEPEQIWPFLLKSKYGYDTINLGVCGSCNESILSSLKNYLKNETVDLLIVGWSGITRYSGDNYNFDFCMNGFYNGVKCTDSQLRDAFYENITLRDMQLRWQSQINEVNRLCSENNIKCIQFSVFGDIPINPKDLLDVSFLEYLAIKQGVHFEYEIPLFEFDLLSKGNYFNIKNFAEKNNFPKTWKEAIVERNSVRPGKYFLICGHPNELGHDVWSDYMQKNINDLFE